jgi:hypothetical protein
MSPVGSRFVTLDYHINLPAPGTLSMFALGLLVLGLTGLIGGRRRVTVFDEIAIVKAPAMPDLQDYAIARRRYLVEGEVESKRARVRMLQGTIAPIGG